jgi:hypothetical protein
LKPMADAPQDTPPRNPADHLKDYQFKPGQSGNPGGRPKDRSPTAVMREVLDRNEIDGKPIKGGRQVLDLMIEVAAKRALMGDYNFFREFMNRMDGKVRDKLELQGGLTIRVEYADDHPEAPEATPGPASDPGGSEAFQCGPVREALGEDGAGDRSAREADA